MDLRRDGKRILLIDGDARKRDLRTTVLRNYEFEVHTAANPTEAMPFWKTVPYDLVLVADPSHQDSAAWVTQIREEKPGQRIGLLVGPPTFIREVARVRTGTELAKASRTVSTMAAVPEVSVASQWQNTIYALVRNWCRVQAVAFNLRGIVTSDGQNAM